MVVGNFPLAGKIAVVTGGGSGISLAFVKLAAKRQDTRVIIADLRLTDEAVDFLKEARNVVFARCDVAVWPDLHNLIDVSEREFGDVPDIYIAGAAVFEPSWSNFWDDTEDERYKAFDINISHVLKLTRIAIRAVLGRDKPGVVLMISSIGGLRSSYAPVMYCTAKHALVGFTKGMAVADNDEGVKVVCICPGLVNTPLWTAHPEKMEQFSYNDSFAITAETAAEAMATMVESQEYPGGSVVTVTPAGMEMIQFVDLIQASSMDVEHAKKFIHESNRPVQEKLALERGTNPLKAR